MKTILILLFTTFSLIVSAQDSWHVINIKGKVKSKQKGKEIKISDKLSDKETLIFSNPTDIVAVMSTKNGKMLLKPKNDGKKSELVCVLSEILTVSSGQLSARAGNITNSIELQKLMSNSDSISILGEYKLWISPKLYLQDNNNFFFISYNYNGEMINKKLKSVADTLILKNEDIFWIDQKQIDMSKVKNINFNYKKDKTFEVISAFTISFLNENEYLNSLNTLKANLPAGSNISDEFQSILSDIGKVTLKDNIEGWISKNLK